MQELLLKILLRYPEFSNTAPHSTINIDIYHNFLRSVHLAVSKTQSDPILSQRFDSINDRFFLGTLDPVNLRWGQSSYRKLGSYDFGTDTITISFALHPHKANDIELLDYVLYHEMLHKKHKFKSSGIRTRSHTSHFRKDEAGFPNAKECEQRLRRIGRRSIIQDEHPFKQLVKIVFG